MEHPIDRESFWIGYHAGVMLAENESVRASQSAVHELAERNAVRVFESNAEPVMYDIEIRPT